MDRFKFRVWDVKYRKMWNSDNELCISCIFECLRHAITHKTDDVVIIEQCTGLKDKNSKLIYEGDIVNTSNFGKCFIEWADDEAGFTLHSIETVNYYSIYCCNGFEVIGNIHENPELLEDK